MLSMVLVLLISDVSNSLSFWWTNVFYVAETKKKKKLLYSCSMIFTSIQHFNVHNIGTTFQHKGLFYF